MVLIPSMIKCFICGKDYSIALFGKLKNDEETPREIIDGSICTECQKIIDNGKVFIIEIKTRKKSL